MTDFQPTLIPSSPEPTLTQRGEVARHRDPGSPVAAMVSWITITLVVLFIAASVFFGGKPSDVLKGSDVTKSGQTGSGQTGSGQAGSGEKAPSENAVGETSGADSPASTPGMTRPAEGAKTAIEAEGTGQPVAGMLSSIARLIFAYPKEQQAAALPQLAMFAKTDTDKLRMHMFAAGVGERASAAEGLRKLIERAGASQTGGAARAGGAGGVAGAAWVIADARLVLPVAESTEGDAALTLLTPAQRDGLITRHGLFAQVLLLPATDPALASVRSSGERIVAVLLLGVFAGLGVGLLAVALFVTGIVLLATGRIRSHYHRPLPGGSVYLETFALFLLGFVVLSLAGMFGLPDGVSATLRWALLGVAFWPMARGVNFSQLRRDIGWTAGGSGARLGPVRWFKEMLLGIAGYLAMLPILGIGLACTMLVMFIINSLSSEPQSAAHPLGDELARAGVWGKVSLVILATVWAPVVEETFFRGALFRHLSGRLHFILAGLLSGLIFAALHPQGLGGIPVLVAAGFNFAMLRQWRGGLIAPMTAHALNNGTVTVLILLMTA